MVARHGALIARTAPARSANLSHVRRHAVPAQLIVFAAAAAVAVSGCGSPASSDERRVELPPATLDHSVLPSIARLTPKVDVAQPSAADEIELDAARGEREAAQVVAWATSGEPTVVLEHTALSGPSGAKIATRDVRTYVEQPMTVERGSPAGRPGTYVDPLIPSAKRPVQVTDTRRMLAWVDVAVPVDATPGTYTGELRIHQAGDDGSPLGGDRGILQRIPITVRVHRAVIPKLPTLGSHVGLDQSQLVRFEGVKPGSLELRDVTERYAAELADARLSVGDVGVLPPDTLPGEQSRSDDDAYLRRVFGRRGVASVRIPFYLTYPFKDPLGADRAAAVSYLRNAAAWARRNGWADRAYVFAFDEPDDSAAGDVRELHELLREADPTLRQLVTREASAPGFRGSVDIWAPNISPSRFRQADVARERRAGNETWWYPSITTFAPYPDLFIDELRPTPRALGWLAWQHGVTGILYWSATHWHEVKDPYADPATYNETDVDGNGDGVLLYPGGPIGLPGTPVPSVRLLQLRDGIEDHDLLAGADCRGTAADRARLRRLARAAAPRLDRIETSPAQVKALRSAAFAVLDREPDGAGCGT